MDRPACGFELERGGRCRGFALPSGRCWNHAPEREAERRAARAKGGRVKAIRGRRPRLERSGQLARWLSDLIVDVLEGKTPPDVGRTCMYGASVLRQVIETSELEHRLDDLEARLQAQPATRRLG